MSEKSTWVGLGEAANILGVHPATLRAWADNGDLPSQRTSGGHRRFRRADLVHWLEAQHAPTSAEAELLVQSAMGRARLEIGEGQFANMEWYQRLDEEARKKMSLYGRHLMTILQNYLTVPDEAQPGLLAQAHEVGRDYGEISRDQRLTLAKAVDGFFTFHDFVIEAAIKMSEVSHPTGPERGSSTRKIYNFTREMIRALIEAFEPATT